jgi:hypothetical protein
VLAESDNPERGLQLSANEGTLAHEVADLCLKGDKDSCEYLGSPIEDIVTEDDLVKVIKTHICKVVPREMVDYVQEYLDYVRSFMCKDSELFTEQRVDFSNIVPDGFGTLDSAVLDNRSRVLHIFDLKYGRTPVEAENNTQGLLYALGFYNENGFLNDFDKITIHIVQPRIYNLSNWTISVEEMISLGESIKPKADLAISKDAPRVPGEKQCEWCSARGNCLPLDNFTKNILGNEFDNFDDNSLPPLSDERKREILDNSDIIVSFLKAVKNEVFHDLNNGGKLNGYKLVEGRSYRKWKEGAKEVLERELGPEAYKKSLIGVTDAARMMDDKVLQTIVHKPKGKLTIVKDTDKREEVVDDIASMFDNFDA